MKLLKSLDDLLRWDMLGAFMLLLHTASSKKELRFLHDEVIPENCRLLREDYLLLEDAWTARHNIDGWPSHTKRWNLDPASSAKLAFLADFASVRRYRAGAMKDKIGIATLREYYAQALNTNRTKSSQDSISSPCVYSCANALGRGFHHFEVSLTANPEARLSTGVFKDNDGFYGILTVQDVDLTEPVVYALLRDLAQYSSPLYGLTSNHASFVVPLGTDLSEHISEMEIYGRCNSRRTFLMMKDGFLPALQQAFTAIDLPVTVEGARFYPTNGE